MSLVYLAGINSISFDFFLKSAYDKDSFFTHNISIEANFNKYFVTVINYEAKTKSVLIPEITTTMKGEYKMKNNDNIDLRADCKTTPIDLIITFQDIDAIMDYFAYVYEDVWQKHKKSWRKLLFLKKAGKSVGLAVDQSDKKLKAPNIQISNFCKEYAQITGSLPCFRVLIINTSSEVNYPILKLVINEPRSELVYEKFNGIQIMRKFEIVVPTIDCDLNFCHNKKDIQWKNFVSKNNSQPFMYILLFFCKLLHFIISFTNLCYIIIK